MSQREYYNKSMDDIVFEDRNKVYGAYYLRSIYKKTLRFSLFITLFAFITAVYSPDIINMIWPGQTAEIQRYDTTAILLSPPPPIKAYSNTAPPPAAQDNLPPTQPQDPAIDRTMVASDKTDPINPKGHSADSSKQGKGGSKSGDGNDLYAMNNVDMPPVFREGGDDGLDLLIKNNLTYPESPRARGIEGEVMVVFTVELDGSISNVSVQGRNDKELEAEAVRVIKLTNGKWIPASKHRIPVRCVCKFPITFVF